MTSKSRFIACTLIALLALFTPASLVAQDYDEATINAVNEHFAKGAKLYYDGRYDEAIAEFEAAHRKIPNAIFLYNISLAQAKKGQLRESLKTAEQADSFGGLGPDEQVQNQARIAAMRRQLVAEDASKDVANRLPPVDPLLDFSKWGWIGSGLVVGGLLGLAGVAVIDGNLKPEIDAYRDAADRGDTAAMARLEEDIRPRQTGGRVLFVLSSAAVLGGAGLLVYDIAFRKEEGAAVRLIPRPDGVFVAFGARF